MKQNQMIEGYQKALPSETFVMVFTGENEDEYIT